MKDNYESIAQNIFSVFVDNGQVGEFGEFLSYLHKHFIEHKPYVLVGISSELAEDETKKKEIKKNILEDLGIGEVVFEIKSDHKNLGDISISGELPALAGSKHARMERTAYEFFFLLIKTGYYKDLSAILKNLEHLYKNYLDEVDVKIFTDTPYSSELEKMIGHFCAEDAQAKRATVSQVIDKDHKGGVKIKWRDSVCDATYLGALKGF